MVNKCVSFCINLTTLQQLSYGITCFFEFLIRRVARVNMYAGVLRLLQYCEDTYTRCLPPLLFYFGKKAK